MTQTTAPPPFSPAPATTAPAAFEGLDRQGRLVFQGLMLGMLVASVSQTIVSPAMPRIVAELGGMEHYSWIATAAMLVSAVTVPIVGKLSDLYGRRAFYLGGLAVFLLGSVLAGLSQSFWMLVGARAVQGLGMGTLMPLSQTIIGDIVPPRSRGRYQGLMGAVFGFSSVLGPLAGGFITDHWGWRWLFVVTLPLGAAAFAFIWRNMHLPLERRDARIDWPGIALLVLGLVSGLLALSLGGSSYAWGSREILTLAAVSLVALVAFVAVELRAAEPVIPLRLFRSSIFTFSNIAGFAVSMMMFGALIYIPIYAQGVMGVSATQSGLILMPLNVAMIVMSIVVGMLITRWGRYKEFMLVGVALMGLGLWLLTRLRWDDTPAHLSGSMVVFGIGLGMCMQVYTLVVQNVVRRRDLGVATAATQFFRNVGSTVGIAVFGTIMTSRLPGAIRDHLSPEAQQQMAQSPGGGAGVGDVLDPTALAAMPPAIAQAVRQGLADSLHAVFVAALPLAGVAFLASLLIKAVPLRDTVHTADEAGSEMLASMGQGSSSAEEVVVPLGRDGGRTRTAERLLSLQLGLLAEQARQPHREMLQRAVADLGDGDVERGLALLDRTAVMLGTSDPAEAVAAEGCAVAVSERGARKGGALSPALREELARRAAELTRAEVVTTPEPVLSDRVEGVDVQVLRSVGADLTSALLVDLHSQDSPGGATAVHQTDPGTR